eukprot:343716-Pleurochrysis_carterae.AAC.1
MLLHFSGQNFPISARLQTVRDWRVDVAASVNVADSADGAPDGMAAEKSSVFVRNLPYDLSDPELEDHFAAIGPVTRAFVVRDKRTREGRGFGFVSFVLPDDACRCRNTTMSTQMLVYYDQ